MYIWLCHYWVIKVGYQCQGWQTLDLMGNLVHVFPLVLINLRLQQYAKNNLIVVLVEWIKKVVVGVGTLTWLLKNSWHAIKHERMSRDSNHHVGRIPCCSCCSVLKAFWHNVVDAKRINCVLSFTLPKLFLWSNCSIKSTVPAPNII